MSIIIEDNNAAAFSHYGLNYKTNGNIGDNVDI